jgi:hypothetical protein
MKFLSRLIGKIFTRKNRKNLQQPLLGVVLPPKKEDK